MKKHFIIIILLCFVLVGLTGCGSSHSSNVSDAEVEAYEQQKKANCSAKSDAYHKCSYSNWEGRCVCKTR